MEDRFNIKITSRTDADAVNLVNSSILAGDRAFDLIFARMTEDGRTLIQSQVLYNLCEVPYLKLDEKHWCPSLYDKLEINGKLCFTTGSIVPSFFYMPVVMAHNITLFADHGFASVLRERLGKLRRYDPE